MPSNFIVDVRLKENDTVVGQVLQLPVLRDVGLGKLQQRTAQALQSAAASETSSGSSLLTFLTQAGKFFGKDPTKWEAVGQGKVDVVEDESTGKRTIKTTTICWGNKLSLLVSTPFYDPRLPANPNDPDLDFSQAQIELNTEADWQKLHNGCSELPKQVWLQFTADQPWSHTQRRRKVGFLLKAKLLAGATQLQLEGAHGVWELSVNKLHHADMVEDLLEALVAQLANADLQVVQAAAAAVWGCATSSRTRRLLTEIGSVEALLAMLQMTLAMDTAPGLVPAAPEQAAAPQSCDRDQLQGFLLGAMSVLLVDGACRAPLLAAEPGLATLIKLSSRLPGYSQPWQNERRTLAARTLCSCIQRDGNVRSSLISSGSLPAIMALMEKNPESADSQGDGAVCFCMAAALAGLILDEEAMQVVVQRQEAAPLFQNCLSLLARTLQSLEPQAEEVVDRDTAVKLAEAAGQAVWGSAYHTINHPGGIQASHLSLLSQLALHTIENRHVPLGKVAHCLAATLATLASDPAAAQLAMQPGNGVVNALLQLVSTSDDDAFAGAGHVRAAAATAIAFLACHPIGAKGDECMWGPYREALLEAGALRVLLEAALAPTQDEVCRKVIEKAAAVGVMYLCTVAQALDSACLAMLAEVMGRTGQLDTMEYLMAGMWILLRTPANRALLSTAFDPKKVAGTSHKFAFRSKMKDAIGVHDLTLSRGSSAGPGLLSKSAAASRRTSRATNSPRSTSYGEDPRALPVIPDQLNALGLAPIPEDGLSSLEGAEQAGQDSGAQPGEEVPEFDADWGLETLVNVGEHWIDSLLQVGPDGGDTPLVKLFEFLVASMCLFLISDNDPLEPRKHEVYEASQRPGTASKTWWTLPLPQAPHSEAQLSPIVERSLAVLIKLLHLTDTIAYKCMTLTAVTLWNCSVRSEAVEQRVVALGVCAPLLTILDTPRWPNCLRDCAAGLLQSLSERWDNVQAMGGLRPLVHAMLTLTVSKQPLLELRGARGLGRIAFKAPFYCPNANRTLLDTKAEIAQSGGVPALIGLVQRCKGRYELLRGGASLVGRAPRLTFDQGDQPQEYERNMRNRPAVLDTLTCSLAALLNLSVLRANQVVIAKHGLTTLLSTNYYFTDLLTGGGLLDKEPEQKLVWLCGGILSNIALHPNNRTRFYRAELRGTAAWEHDLEQGVQSQASMAASGPGLGPPNTLSSGLFSSDSCGMSKAWGSANIVMASDGTPIMPASTTVRPKAKGMITGLSLPDAGEQRLMNFTLARPTAPGQDGMAQTSARSMGQTMSAFKPGATMAAASVGAVMAAGDGTTMGSPRAAAKGTIPAAMGNADYAVGGGMSGDLNTTMSSTGSRTSKTKFLKWFNSLSPRQEQADDHELPQLERSSSSMMNVWLENERNSMRFLNHLLCRPLRDLWTEDPPELRARAGAARWRPVISEYRQAEGTLVSNVALRLLTTDAPTETKQDLAASAQLVSSTGALGLVDSEDSVASGLGVSPSGATLDRPGTTQRSGGRIAMTVLRPQQQLQQQQQAATALPQLPSPSTAQQAQQAASVPSQPGAASRGLKRSFLGAKQGETLKVVMAPQRTRTTISFEQRPTAGAGDNTLPRLTLFEHVAGARVLEDLFPYYRLPNGKKAYYYYDAGVVVDEVEVLPSDPPQRPTSVPQALQQNMPLASVLNSISKPPGSAPPFIPFKPVPRLVPLPSKHTLPVQQPNRFKLSNFGELREDNLQMVLLARRITQQLVDVREEALEEKEVREAWRVEQSAIWRPRLREADSRGFWDTPACRDRMFEADWARACNKEKFATMMARENKNSKSPQDDKAALKEIHDALCQHYELISQAFLFYPTGSSADVFHMGLNNFTALLEDCKISDADSQYVRRSDCDTLFIVANYQPDKKDPSVAVNDEHALMRFEFLEAVVRLAVAKYGKGQQTDSVATAIQMLAVQNLAPGIRPIALTSPNAFRTERLYTEEVDLLYKKHLVLLKAVYSACRRAPSGGGLRLKVLRMDSWLGLLEQGHLLDADLGLQQAQLCFLWSHMMVVDEIKDFARHESLSFVDFLEALARVAELKSLPSFSDLEDAGYDNILAWQMDKEANSSMPPEQLPEILKPRPMDTMRPLYAGLDVMLNLLFRRLAYDPAQPNAPFSYDACLRVMKRQDKEMGS